MVASLIFRSCWTQRPSTPSKALGALRTWWFALAFTCIGLEYCFVDLFRMGGGRPAGAFLGAQVFNILWTLLLAYLIFGGILFGSPKL